jgi:hypothetical protein
MASISAITFNTGSTIPGTTQVNSFAIGTTAQDYSTEPGGLRWWASPDSDLGYIIVHQNINADQPNPEGIPNVRLGFWRSEFKTEESFIQRVEYITLVDGTPQSFESGVDANTWLINNGYWSTYSQYPSSLLLYLDSGDSLSYSGSGNIWDDLTSNNNNATLYNTPTYLSNYGGILQFDDISLEYGTIPDIGNISQWTVEVWFRLSNPLTGKVTSIITNEFDLVNKLNFTIGTNNAPTNSNLAVGFYDGTWHTTAGFVPSVGVWYQVVGTYDGSIIRQYINGVASGGTLNYVGTPQSGGEVRLMRRWDESLTQGNLTDGDLAIVKIYNTSLNSTEILENYNLNFSRFIE